VLDNIPPTLNVNNQTIPCEEYANLEPIEVVRQRLEQEFADDPAYDGQVITVSSVPEVHNRGSCDNEFSVVRTFTATEVTGNAKSASYTITVQDNTIPVLVGVLPTSQYYECDIGDPPSVTAMDNCAGADYTAGELDATSVFLTPTVLEPGRGMPLTLVGISLPLTRSWCRRKTPLCPSLCKT
jgi:hypothetical protein